MALEHPTTVSCTDISFLPDRGCLNVLVDRLFERLEQNILPLSALQQSFSCAAKGSLPRTPDQRSQLDDPLFSGACSRRDCRQCHIYQSLVNYKLLQQAQLKRTADSSGDWDRGTAKRRRLYMEE